MHYPQFEYVTLSFLQEQTEPAIDEVSSIDLFFGVSGDLLPVKEQLCDFLSTGERSKADSFRYESDRDTYILSHAMLRLEISQVLNIHPGKIVIETTERNKPYINGDPLYFNLTHTREAFSFSFSPLFYSGIDLERLNADFDLKSIAGSFFTSEEIDYIFKPGTSAAERFFLLWTRKEAFIKGIGTGIFDNINRFGVCRKQNLASREIFVNLISEDISDVHYISSARIGDYCLSLATPEKVRINFNNLDHERVVSDLDKFHLYAIS